MHYVYVLKSIATGRLYKGYSADWEKRLIEHNNGKVKFTKSGKPWVLLYYQAFINKTDALREEKFLKSGKGRERIKYLLQKTLSQ